MLNRLSASFHDLAIFFFFELENSKVEPDLNRNLLTLGNNFLRFLVIVGIEIQTDRKNIRLENDFIHVSVISKHVYYKKINISINTFFIILEF